MFVCLFRHFIPLPVGLCLCRDRQGNDPRFVRRLCLLALDRYRQGNDKGKG
jgi:hypothetical protein